MFDEKSYWDKRYAKGNTSGCGSYGDYAKYKADVINEFIQQEKLNSIIEFGCGDGNQLGMININEYTGLDISKEAISMCIDTYCENKNKSFLLYDPDHFLNNTLQFDASISLEVIFHIIDDNKYRKYLHDLFSCASKYVIIYSSNFAQQRKETSHIKHRNFTTYVDATFTSWTLKSFLKNPFSDRTSNFYIYKRI